MCFKSKIQTQKEKLYRSIHFNYTRRGGINAAARDHRLGELKKVNCYSFTSDDTVVFSTYTIKKKKLGGLHTSAHTHIHTHKQNQQKEGVGYFTQQSRKEKKKKKKEQRFLNF
jgi:hypothetical protein